MRKLLDATGERFGRLTAIKYSHTEHGKGAVWEFKCDCGNTKEILLSRVRNGYVNSCGCLRKENARKAIFKDITGQKFNHLTVVSYAGQSNGRTMWNCLCDCGNTVVVDSNSLKSGNTTACGCRKSEGWRNSLTHGKSHTRLYRIWRSMKQRCYNVKNEYYMNYGGRGITICAEWLNDFQAFYDWSMAHGYQDDLTIDRKNNDKGYSPENCQWVTRTAQMNNTRINKIIEYKGRKQTMAEWAKELNYPYRILYSRINTYRWSVEKAFETPIQKRGGCH